MENPPISSNDMYGSQFEAGSGGAGEAASTRAHDVRNWFGVLVFRVCSSILACASRLTILLSEVSVQAVNYFVPEVMLRYNVWEHLRRVLGTERAIALADHFRKTMPSLAPCNPFLKDAVVSSIEETQFIARWPEWTPSTHGICVLETHEIKGFTLENPPAWSYCFRIGSGEIRVDAFPEYENNFKFESRARGILLEEFVTVTDWKRVAKIISILSYWENSPALGVIENLCVRNGKDVYCHCLNLQSIVEGVCKSPEQFSHFKLSQSKRFYVGFLPQQNQNKDENSMSFLSTFIAVVLNGWKCLLRLCQFITTILGFGLNVCITFLDILSLQGISTFINVVWNLLATYFYQDGKASVIVSGIALYLFLPLVALVLVKKFITGLRFKVFVHRVLACCLPDAWRDDSYLWLKRRGSFLAFCDDFNPVLHRATDETELITLHNCTIGPSFTQRNLQLDWNNIRVNVHESFQWEWNNTRFVHRQQPPTPRIGTTVRSLRRHTPEGRDRDFEWHQGEWRHFELRLGARTVRAISLCDTIQNGEVLVQTRLQLDDDPEILLRWNEPRYLLFVYLMVKWKSRRFGVIRSWGKVGSTNYYHVFSTYELAEYIATNREVVSYYIFRDAPQPTDMVAGYIHCKDVGIAVS